MKKALLVFLYLLLSLLLPACSSVVTYESLHDEADLTGDYSKVEKFEKKAHKAEAFFENKRLCLTSSRDYGWFCQHRGVRRIRERDLTDIDELVKAYRNERDCRCVTREFLRDILYGRRF